MQQIKERGALPMIDRGDIRQAIDRLQQYLGFTAGRWLWSFEHGHVDCPIAKTKKRAGMSERLMYEQSHRDYLPLWLSASSFTCHGLLIITVITPLPGPARQKCQRTEFIERGNYRHADASA